MADTSGVFQASSDVGPGFDAEEEEKDKEKRLNALMEKLKMKAGQLRSSAESAKILRMAITDKRHQLEILEKSLLHRHLETLQKAFRVHNMSLMVDRLELCAKEVGLKFTAGHPEGTIFIGSDMFYVEVQLDASTVKVKDVKVMQGTDNVPSPEITKSLRDDNTDLFVEHLRGLSAVYPISGDKKLRSKCFLAMQSLETDLNLLAKLQSSISSVSNYIHKSPLGVLEPRVAGLPMKITYFVGPYDLLDTRTRTSVPMTIESIRERKLGHSVTVGIESSSPHKLPTMPLMTISKTTDGKSLPSFAAINSVNSSSLPAVFVLRLQRPLPMALSIIKKIQATTGIDFLDLNTVQPLLSLLIQSASRKAKHTHYDTSQGLSVTLPDQQHMYYFSTVNGSADLHGSMVSSIPFVHPTSVPKIIMFLRQQVLFNTLIGSCIRPAVSRPDASTHDADCVMTFEVCPVSLHHVTVLFEHPLKDTMTTGEFDLCDVTAVKCKICTAANEEAICNDDYTTQVLQRCLSLPVTLRAIMQKARSRLGTEVVPPSPEPYNIMTLTPPLPTAAPPMVADRSAASLMLSKVGQERRQAFISTHMYHDRMGSLHRELMSGGTVQQNMHHMHPAPPTAVTEAGGVGGGGITNNGAFESNFIDTSLVSNDMMEAMKAEKISKNPMLARLLDQDEVPSMANNAKVAVSQKQHSMLSALLDDDSTSSLTPVRHRKSRKRKSVAESRSPINSSPSKHYRSGDEDGSSGPCQDVGCCINSNTSPLAGLLASTPPGGGGETYTHESHVSKLASTLENIIKHESRHLSKCQHSELASILNEPDDYKKPSPRSQASSLSNDLDRSNQNVHYGAGDCHRDSAAVDLPSANSAFQRTNSNDHVKMNSNTWPSPSDFDSGGRGMRPGRNSSFDRQLKGGETKDVDGRIKGGGALVCDGNKSGSSIDLTRKTNRSIRGSVESERGSQDSDVFMKEQIVTPTDFIADPKLAATPKSARSHSAESDPFDFNASLLNPDSNLVGAESDSTELDLDACDRQAFGCTPAVAPPKVTRSGSKNKNISTDSPHDGKERKKERRDGKDALSTWSNSAKSKQLFNLKVNTKDLTTEMIVKELPHHCITSPDLVEEPKTQKSKDSKKTLNADKSSDALTDDSDVFQPPSGGGNFSGSGHRLMSNGSKQSEQGTTASRSSKGQKRKQRLSKHGDGEKKRRRAEESKKDHLSKKQRIYDFDAEVNDNDGYTTPHVLKPTKIKITTAGGRMQVQPSVAVTPPAATSSKAPPLASTKYSSASSGSTIKLVKSVHGGGDRVSPKLSHSGTSGGGSGRPNSRVKSESGGGTGRERVDSKLQRTPTIKLKPINMPHNASAATTTSTKSSHSPATPSSGKSSTAPVVIASTQSSSAGHAKKPSQVKTRKNSLSAVIDKLTKQHSGGTGGALGLGGVVSEKDSEMPTKEKADAIRLKILSEGNKPSTPLKESFRSSQGGVKGSKLTFETKLNQKSLEHRRTSDLSRQQHVQSQPSSSGGSTAHNQPKPNLTKQGGAPAAPSGGHKGSSVSGDVVSSSRAESGKSTSVVNNVAAVNRSVSLPKGAVSVSSSGLKPTTPASSGLKSSTPPSASLVSRTMSVPLAAGQRGTSQGQKSPGAQSGTKTLSSVSKQSSASSVVNTPKAPSAAAAGCTKSASTATGKYLPQVATPKPVNCTAAIKNTTVSGSKTPSPVVQGATKTVPRPPTPDTSKTQAASVNGAAATVTATTSAKTVVPSKPSGDPRENQTARQGSSHDGDRQRKPKVDSTAADADQPKRHFLDVVSKISSSPGDAATESRPAASNGGAGAGTTDGSGWTASGAKPTPAHSHGRSHSIHCTDTTTRSNSVTNTKSFRTDGATVATPSGRNTPTSRGAGAVNNVAESDGGVLDLSAVARTSDAAATETKPTPVTSTARKCENAATPSRDGGPAASVADNSHSENKENTKFDSTSYDGVFKAPTPKSAKSDERSRDAAPTRARAVASPHSDVSSPEDGLVIDCPGYSARSPATKQHTTNSTRSPQSPAVVQPCSPAAVTDAVAWSPGAKSAQSPASRKSAKLSPVKSPMSQRNLVGSPPSNSPCEIDDDLMDAALML